MHLGAPATGISLVGLRARRAQLRFSRWEELSSIRPQEQGTNGHLRRASKIPAATAAPCFIAFDDLLGLWHFEQLNRTAMFYDRMLFEDLFYLA